MTVRAAGKEQTVNVAAGQEGQVVFETEPGFPFYDTFVHVVRFTSARRALLPGANPARHVGSFVRINLEVARRPRP